MKMRSSGVLCPVSSLSSRFGIGDFGAESKRFVDLLAQGGYRLWQILPLNPLGYGHSPYQPFSSFAIDEQFADLDALAEKGLIAKAPDFDQAAPKVLYEDIRAFKDPYLHQAFAAEMAKHPQALASFLKKHSWVRDWALFMMNKRREGYRSWTEWEPAHRDMILHHPVLTPEEQAAFDYEIWLQKTLYEEWGELRGYANKKGIRLIGDVPFYVGFDSCDVWANQQMFLLDPATKQPLWIAGVPPDYFSVTGQRWGNPIYDWDRLEKENFFFIINRLRLNGELYDIVRLDHFRAFDTYWKIPASCPTAVVGSWVEAPGYKLFDLYFKEVKNLEIIAEDLGNLRPQVLVLRDHYGFPGMNVVEFTFRDAMIAMKPDLDRPNMVAYVGTHDNDPLKGYFAKLATDEQALWLAALAAAGFAQGGINEKILNYTLSLQANYAIVALQDLLDLGSEARMNVPGVIDDVNWTWRIPDYAAFAALLPHLKGLNAKYGR
jgi:4-alpha-glucanotransferase